MKKIDVKICLGTTCFVMGASHLQNLKGIVSEKYGNDVTVTECDCLGVCTDSGEYWKAPYVKVNDVIVSKATTEKVLVEIERQWNNND